MKWIFFIVFMFVFLNSFAQVEDTLNKKIKVDIPKNQFSIYWNLIGLKSNETLFQLEFARLFSSLPSDNSISNKYFYSSLSLSNFEKALVIFDKNYVMNLSDSAVQFRSSGSATKDYYMKLGFERQERLFFSKNRKNGIQLNFDFYSIIGFSKKLDQYLYRTQKLETFFDGNFSNNYFNFYEKYPIIGERSIQYLRLGIGSNVGFDFIETFNDFNLLVGLKLSLVNLEFNMLTKSEIVKDPDELFKNRPRKLT